MPSVVAQLVARWIRATVVRTGIARSPCHLVAWVPCIPGKRVRFAPKALVRFSVWLSLFLP